MCVDHVCPFGVTRRILRLTFESSGGQISVMKRFATLGLVILGVGCGDGGSGAPTGGGGAGGDVDDGAGGSVDGGVGGVGGTRSAGCSNDGACVSNPGGAWMGPFAVINSDIGCEGPFPDQAVELFQGFNAGTASCDCSCGAATAVCSTQIRATGWALVDCSLGQGQHTVGENECYNTFSASHSVRLGTASASCGAGTVTADLPTPTFARSVDVCGGFSSAPGECEVGQTCVPKPSSNFEAGICYVQQGDHACPAGFSDRILSYTGFSDTRACAASCSCQGSGAVCSVNVNRYTGTNCGSPQDVVTIDSGSNSCIVPDSGDVRSIRPNDVQVERNGTCAPGAIGVIGTVQGEGATTVCCG